VSAGPEQPSSSSPASPPHASQAPPHAPQAPPQNLHDLYYKHFGDCKRERRLFATGSFFVTFAGVRGITHAIRAERGPFKNITTGGRHIHHMTFGIAGLLSVGYLWMLEIGINEERWSSRATAGAFGAGAALTLDEFALWLNLEDVYWAKKGRESIDAVVLFGSLLGISSLGRGFFRELVKGREPGIEAHPSHNGSGPTAGGSGPSAGGSGPSAGGSGPSAGGSGPAAGGSGPAAGGSGPAAGGSGPAAGGSGPAAG
jgi:hypothetical protein